MSARNGLTRLAGLAVLGGGAYAGTAFLVYGYLTAGKKDADDVAEELEGRGGRRGFSSSYVTDDRRSEQFERIADTYDDLIGRDEAVMGINLLRRSLLYFHAKGDTLEVAAGTGRNIGLYPRSVRRILLTDSSRRMLDQARRKISSLSNVEERSRYACLQVDAGRLRDDHDHHNNENENENKNDTQNHLNQNHNHNIMIPDDTFDTVVDTFGLCSYDDPVAVLNEMGRVCRPDGKILLLEHGRSKTWDSITRYLDRHAERHAKNWGCVWNRDLDDILLRSELIPDRVDTWHFGTTYYAVCRPPPPDKSKKSSVADHEGRSGGDENDPSNETSPPATTTATTTRTTSNTMTNVLAQSAGCSQTCCGNHPSTTFHLLGFPFFYWGKWNRP